MEAIGLSIRVGDPMKIRGGEKAPYFLVLKESKRICNEEANEYS